MTTRRQQQSGSAKKKSRKSSPVGREEETTSKLLFLTVGTTQFDSLIGALNSDAEPFLAWLIEHKFDRVVMQIGAGQIIPNQLIDRCEQLRQKSSNSTIPRIEWFRFSPDIVEYMRSASLVISHAGAGSIMESLRLGRPLLVVINNQLMHNHQLEVAEALEEDHYLYQTVPTELIQRLKEGNWNFPLSNNTNHQSHQSTSTSSIDTAHQSRRAHFQLLRYPSIDAQAFPSLLNDILSTNRTPSLIPSTLLTCLIPMVIATIMTWSIFS